MKQFILISLAFMLIKEFSLAETSTPDYKYLNDMDYYKSGVDFYEKGEFKKSFIDFILFKHFLFPFNEQSQVYFSDLL